jgi:hypothetical protein
MSGRAGLYQAGKNLDFILSVVEGSLEMLHREVM